MSLTAFAVKSSTEADNGVDTDVIRAVCRGMQGKRVGLQCNSAPGHAVLGKVSSEASCEDPDRRVQKLVSNRDLWSFDISSRVRRLFWPSITVCNQFSSVLMERSLN